MRNLAQRIKYSAPPVTQTNLLVKKLDLLKIEIKLKIREIELKDYKVKFLRGVRTSSPMPYICWLVPT